MHPLDRSCCALSYPISSWTRIGRLAWEDGDPVVHSSRGRTQPEEAEILHSSSTKSLTDLLECRRPELKSLLDRERLAQGNDQLLVHYLSGHANRMVFGVLEVSGDEMDALSAEVKEEYWDIPGLLEA